MLFFGTQSDVPEGIPHYEQRNVLLVRIPQNLITFGFDHVTVSKDELFSVECFLAASLARLWCY